MKTMRKLTEFGKALRHVRADMDESQAEMAARLGVNRVFLSGLERGARPVSLNLLNRIRCVYNQDDKRMMQLFNLAVTHNHRINKERGRAR